MTLASLKHATVTEITVFLHSPLDNYMNKELNKEVFLLKERWVYSSIKGV